MPEEVLRVENLSYHYPDGRRALEGVSFSLERGERVALIGPNGAGKSTLLLHLNGILPGRSEYEHHHHLLGSGDGHRHGSEPHVWVEGIPVVDGRLGEVRRRVGLLFQDPDDQLFCPTVLEDVMFGPRNQGKGKAESAELARRCLAQVGLDGFEDRLPHHLSYGEKRRVCLAGVLACQPTLLALDEPTSNLDPRTRRRLIAILQGLDATLLVATHDLELAWELCPRVILLEAGRLCADGPAEQVLADEPLLLEHGLELPLSVRLANP
jgi:energy-coupling factor transporter ATP-binding protein EcfA2